MTGWNRFWFEPTDTSTLALVRFSFGLIVLAWTVSLLPTLGPLFSPDGVLPRQPEGEPGSWGLLAVVNSDAAVSAVFVVLCAASVALALGYRTRIAAALVFIGLVSLQRRNPYVFNSGDTLLRVTAFYLLLAPAGAAYSLDRLRRHGRNQWWTAPERAPWALRLIQIQLSVLYLSSVWAKLRGEKWNDGTATAYALGLTDLQRFPLPGVLTDNLLAVNVLTYGTLAVELAVAVLIWNRACRPWVAVVGLLLHAATAYSLRVGFFGPALLVSYLAFLPPERARAMIAGLRKDSQDADATPGRRRSRLRRSPRRRSASERSGAHVENLT